MKVMADSQEAVEVKPGSKVQMPVLLGGLCVQLF